MAICVKKLLAFVLFAVLFCPLGAKEIFASPQIINADGTDLLFREILLEKSLNTANFKCTVTHDNLPGALKKLQNKQCDMILVKRFPASLKLDKNLDCKVFAETPILVFVNKSSKVKKLKISDLRQIWNGSINQWDFFDRSNIFSIHRFAMPYNDSVFDFIKRSLQLRDGSSHFPLNTTQQIISMVNGNPNAIGLGTFEKDLDFKSVKLVQITDENGKNIKFNMPHTVIFRKTDKNKVENFLKNGKK